MSKVIINTLPYDNSWQLVNSSNFKQLIKKLKASNKYKKVTYRTRKENNKIYGKIFVTEEKILTENDFIDSIRHIVKISIENLIFDSFYDGNNYNDITNNINKYISIELIKRAIQNIKEDIKDVCKIYELPCKLELELNEIIAVINNDEYVIYSW